MVISKEFAEALRESKEKGFFLVELKYCRFSGMKPCDYLMETEVCCYGNGCYLDDHTAS
jgi:hypothetical protein